MAPLIYGWRVNESGSPRGDDNHEDHEDHEDHEEEAIKRSFLMQNLFQYPDVPSSLVFLDLCSVLSYLAIIFSICPIWEGAHAAVASKWDLGLVCVLCLASTL
mgnify:FL=1